VKQFRFGSQRSAAHYSTPSILVEQNAQRALNTAVGAITL